jgi:hypothetical protein
MKLHLSQALLGWEEDLSKGKQQVSELRGGKYAARVQVGYEKDGSPAYRYFDTMEEYESYLQSSGKKKKKEDKDDDKKKDKKTKKEKVTKQRESERKERERSLFTAGAKKKKKKKEGLRRDPFGGARKTVKKSVVLYLGVDDE